MSCALLSKDELFVVGKGRDYYFIFPILLFFFFFCLCCVFSVCSLFVPVNKTEPFLLSFYFIIFLTDAMFSVAPILKQKREFLNVQV